MHASSFEDYVTIERKDRYYLIFSIEASDRMHPTSSGVVRPLTYESTKNMVVTLQITLMFN